MSPKDGLTAAPKVSVLVANYNGADHLDACLASLRRQTLTDIEVIVIDDGSTDDSAAKVRAVAAGDPRIRLLRNAGAKGPAGARNTGLAAAKGEWIAVVDSDDMIYARRFETLIAAGEADRADIVADDLLVFDDLLAFDERARSAHRHLTGPRGKAPTSVSAEAYLDENHLFANRPNLGVLKPIIRRDALGAHRYDETLRIAEDFDFILRLLQGGARFRIYPQPTYLYRKHAASISHVLRRDDIVRMIASQDALVAGASPPNPALGPAFDRRRRSMDAALAFTDLVDALKRRALGEAARIALRSPRAAALLRMPVIARLQRLAARPRPAKARGPQCCLVSRQRIVGPTNGSSTYLLAIARAIREIGVEVHLLQPSPMVLGRWPVLKFRPEMDVFSSVRIRGTLAVGRFRIALDPRIFVAAALTVLGGLAGRLGWRPAWLQIQPAPYAIGAPWTGDDLIYLAQRAAPISDVVVFDYAFQTVASPYILRPEPMRFTVMHDLFSSRAEQFSAAGSSDSVSVVSEALERALLAGGDVTIAIQKLEAAYVAQAIPGHRVLTSMMPVVASPAPQPGEGDGVLFVGSGAAPNVSGLAWFLSEIWPHILQKRPAARLTVAGSVGRSFPSPFPNVDFLGVVPDLAPLYASSAVVISPLRAGSGLKIKLVEALAEGKAIVVTSTTLQGVTEEVGDSVLVADEPAAFAEAVVSLLADPALRRRQAERALKTAAESFSEQACMGALQAAVGEALAAGGVR